MLGVQRPTARVRPRSRRWATCRAEPLQRQHLRRLRRWFRRRGRQRLGFGLRGVPLDERRRDGRPGRPAGGTFSERGRRRLRRWFGRRGIRQLGVGRARRSAGRAAAGWSAWATCRGEASTAMPMASPPMVPSSWETAPRPRASRRSAGPAAAGWSAWATCRGESLRAVAEDISADGSVVVGVRQLAASGYSRRFAGRAAAGWSVWATCRAESSESYGFGVSADGSVVVGQSSSASGIEAFRWTSGGGMVGLGDLPGGIF